MIRRVTGKPAATVTLYWSERRKEWDVVANVSEYTACVQAATTVPMTTAQAWILARAVASALEEQLPL